MSANNKTKSPEMMKLVKGIKDFFDRDSIKSLLMSLVTLLVPERKDIKFNLNIGGGSHTDGKTVVAGLPEILFKRSKEEIMTALQALVGHESQHVKSSNFIEYGKFLDEIDHYLNKHYNIPNKIGRKVAQGIGNSIEDGRIEKILCTRYPGFIKKIKFLNGLFWKEQPIDDMKELQAFLYCLTVYSVMGLDPQNYDKHWTGTALDENYQKVKPLIIKGINARTCSDGLEICREVFYTVEEYLSKLIEETMESEPDSLEDMSGEPSFTSSSETESNSSKPVSTHFKPEKSEEKEEREKSKSSKKSKEKEEAPEEDETEEESDGGEESKDAKDETEEESDEKSKSGSEENDEDDTDDESDEKSKGKSDDDSEDDEDDNEDGDSDAKSEDEDSKSKDSKSDEDLVEDEMDSLSDDLIDDAKSKLDQAEKNEKELEDKKNREESKNISDEILKKIKDKYEGDDYTSFREEKGFPLTNQLPENLKSEGRRARREVEEMFRNKEALNLRNQSKGVLSQSSLWKISTNDYNVFVKKGYASLSDFVAFFLQDGSGSMREKNKEIHSSDALCIMEEAFKGIIPFKITTFSVGGSDVIHYLVKDFNQEDLSKNYSYNFRCSRQAGGGNKDGYSIRMATEELLKRPEKDKILFVMSDGIPTEYRHGEAQGVQDVREAIREARKAGILVLSIVFGTESFRARNIERYKYMYESDIISCSPDQITNQLLRALNKIVSR